MIVCVVFLNAVFLISFNSREIKTAAPVFKINFTILSFNVFQNAVQNPGAANIFRKFSSPTNSGLLIPWYSVNAYPIPSIGR